MRVCESSIGKWKQARCRTVQLFMIDRVRIRSDARARHICYATAKRSEPCRAGTNRAIASRIEYKFFTSITCKFFLFICMAIKKESNWCYNKHIESDMLNIVYYVHFHSILFALCWGFFVVCGDRIFSLHNFIAHTEIGWCDARHSKSACVVYSTQHTHTLHQDVVVNAKFRAQEMKT